MKIFHTKKNILYTLLALGSPFSLNPAYAAAKKTGSAPKIRQPQQVQTFMAALENLNRHDAEKFLVEDSALLEYKNKNGDTPLLIVLKHQFPAVVPIRIKEKYINMIHALLARNANISASDSNGKNALMIAAERGFLDIVQMILKKMATTNGTSIESLDRQGNTAILLAGRNGHIQVAETLLRHGATADRANLKGETLLQIARDDNNLELQRLLQKYPSPKKTRAPRVRKAASVVAPAPASAAAKDTTISSPSKILLQKCCLSESLLSDLRGGYTAKIIALLRKNPELLNNCDPANGWTPLMIAAYYGHDELLHQLLVLGAFVGAKAYDDTTTAISLVQTHLTNLAKPTSDEERQLKSKFEKMLNELLMEEARQRKA